MPNKYQHEHDVLCQAILKAKEALLDIVKNGFEKAFKEHNDPVTTGDLTVNSILQEELTQAFPEIGWLSEETKDNLERLNKEKVWIVDPVDGTKEFVMGLPEYAISVALVENGRPVIGVVLNTLKDEIYSAILGEGAFLNGQRIHVNSKLPDKPVIVASRSEDKRGEWEDFKEVAEVVITGSIAYKLALVASGDADATFSLGPKHEWDIAAGHLIVEEAGGIVSDKYGESFIYNQENTLVNSIVGTSERASEKIFEMIQKSRNKNG